MQRQNCLNGVFNDFKPRAGADGKPRVSLLGDSPGSQLDRIETKLDQVIKLLSSAKRGTAG
jgi:hypothetical protein